MSWLIRVQCTSCEGRLLWVRFVKPRLLGFVSDFVKCGSGACSEKSGRLGIEDGWGVAAAAAFVFLAGAAGASGIARGLGNLVNCVRFCKVGGIGADGSVVRRARLLPGEHALTLLDVCREPFLGVLALEQQLLQLTLDPERVTARLRDLVKSD